MDGTRPTKNVLTAQLLQIRLYARLNTSAFTCNCPILRSSGVLGRSHPMTTKASRSHVSIKGHNSLMIPNMSRIPWRVQVITVSPFLLFIFYFIKWVIALTVQNLVQSCVIWRTNVRILVTPASHSNITMKIALKSPNSTNASQWLILRWKKCPVSGTLPTSSAEIRIVLTWKLKQSALLLTGLTAVGTPRKLAILLIRFPR